MGCLGDRGQGERSHWQLGAHASDSVGREEREREGGRADRGWMSTLQCP